MQRDLFVRINCVINLFKSNGSRAHTRNRLLFLFMENITCKSCGSNEYHITEGLHNTAWCKKCGAYIKHIAKDKPAFHFGKYSGKYVEEINDIRYLEWCYLNVRLTERIKVAVKQQIELLKYNSL